MDLRAVPQPFGLSLSKPIPSLQQKEKGSFDGLRTNGRSGSIPYAIPPPSRGEGSKKAMPGAHFLLPDFLLQDLRWAVVEGDRLWLFGN